MNGQVGVSLGLLACAFAPKVFQGLLWAMSHIFVLCPLPALTAADLVPDGISLSAVLSCPIPASHLATLVGSG